MIMTRHANFCTSPNRCDTCSPMWREELVLERATKAARERVTEKSIRQSLREWDSVSQVLMCSLCEKTPTEADGSKNETPPQ